MRLDFNAANYLAYIFDNSKNLGHVNFSMDEKQLLVYLLQKLMDGSFLFSTETMDKQGGEAKFAALLSQLQSFNGSVIPEYFYEELRGCLGCRQWMAMIIPSGTDEDIDTILCDPKLLDLVVKNLAYNQGMVLQLESAPENIFSCYDVYPAFKVALTEVINWPGMLLWMPGGDAIFLPVFRQGDNEIEIEMRVQWIFSQLSETSSFKPGILQTAYQSEFPELFEFDPQRLNIFHISDLRLGNQHVNRRINHVKSLIGDCLQDLGDQSTVVPLVSGNFIDGPRETNLPYAIDFWRFLDGLGIEKTVWALGSQDVRRDGELNDCFSSAVNYPTDQVTWFDQEKVAIININTVKQGNPDTGMVNAEQLEDIQYEIERKQNHQDYIFIAVMHHALQSEHGHASVSQFYNHIFADKKTLVEAFSGQDKGVAFFKQYPLKLVLQGKGFSITNDLSVHNFPVIGGESLTGKQSNVDGSIYFCMNIVSINQGTNKLACRTIVSRRPEQGLTQNFWHELIYRN